MKKTRPILPWAICALLLLILIFTRFSGRWRAGDADEESGANPAKAEGAVAADDAEGPRGEAQGGSDSPEIGGPALLEQDLQSLRSLAKARRNPEVVDRAADLLRNKYRDDPHATLRLLVKQANIYRDLLRDQNKAALLFEEAKDALDATKVQLAIEEMTLLTLLGETYYGENEREKALENHKRALEYPITEKPYFKVRELGKLYARAALRVVELTPFDELHELHLHPYGSIQIQKRFPDKVFEISPTNPGLAAWRARIVRWLEIKLNEAPPDIPERMRPHMEAVVEYIKQLDDQDREFRIQQRKWHEQRNPPVVKERVSRSDSPVPRPSASHEETEVK